MSSLRTFPRKGSDGRILELIDRLLPDYDIMRNRIKDFVILTINHAIDNEVANDNQLSEEKKKECIAKMHEILDEIDDIYLSQKNKSKPSEDIKAESILIYEKVESLVSLYLPNYDKEYGDSYSAPPLIINNKTTSFLDYISLNK